MANNTIASLNVKLLANISGFVSGMASAARPLADFAGEVAGTSLKIGGMLSAITGLVGAGSLALLTKQSMEAIDVNAKLADRLGTSTEGLVGLQAAAGLAGVSNEELTGGLEKMLKALGGAADDGETTSSVFKKLGLDAAALANMPADQAFASIAQRLAEIQNPAERATAPMQIFGKAGQGLLPLLMSGAEGIKAAQVEAQKLGLTYSRVDAAKVEAANDSFTRMTSVITGVGNQLAIGLSPYIDAAATKLTGLATAGGGIGPMVGGAIEWVAKALAVAADYTNLLPAAFHGFRAGALQAIASVLEAIDYLGGGLVKFLNLLPHVNFAWTGSFAGIAKGLQDVAAEEAQKLNDSMDAFQRGDASAKVAKVFDDIRAKSQASAQAVADNAAKMSGAFKNLEDNAANLKKVAEVLADLQKQVAQFGMTEGQKKLADLTALGASPEQVAQAKAAAAQLDAMQEAKKQQDDMASKAKEVIESTRTPMEKYESQIGNLGDLLNSGAIDWDTYGRAVRKARAELEKGSETPELKAPDLFQAGSAAAARFTYDQSRGTQTLAADDVPKRQLVESQDQGRTLKRIDASLAPSGTDPDTTIAMA